MRKAGVHAKMIIFELPRSVRLWLDCKEKVRKKSNEFWHTRRRQKQAQFAPNCSNKENTVGSKNFWAGGIYILCVDGLKYDIFGGN